MDKVTGIICSSISSKAIIRPLAGSTTEDNGAVSRLTNQGTIAIPCEIMFPWFLTRACPQKKKRNSLKLAFLTSIRSGTWAGHKIGLLPTVDIDRSEGHFLSVTETIGGNGSIIMRGLTHIY